MSQTKALFRLQTIDLDLETQRKRLRVIKNTLEQESALVQAQAAVAAAEAALKPQEARVKELNLEIQALATQGKELDSRLYSNTVTNPKELTDLQNKIAEIKRRQVNTESLLLETMIAVEELQASLAEAQANLDQVGKTLSDEHAQLRTEGRELQRSIKVLKENREALAQLVSPEFLKVYEQMRPAKQGRVIAALDGESCSVCGVGQTTTLVQKVRQGHEMILCSNCGRILIAL